jgi:hypothetical protein
MFIQFVGIRYGLPTADFGLLAKGRYLEVVYVYLKQNRSHGPFAEFLDLIWQFTLAAAADTPEAR